MGRRTDGKRQKQGAQSRLSHVYEGEAVLGELLASAGSPLEVEDVKAQFAEACADEEDPAEAIQLLFEGEPRFRSPEVARRLYSNLFGLWERIARQVPLEPGADGEVPVAPPQAPKPEPHPERPLSDEFVEAAWRYLEELPERERDRLRDRFENTQAELADWMQMNSGEAAAALENADTLLFELWATLELAEPSRKRRRITFHEAEAQPGTELDAEPALERYVQESLEEAQIEEVEPLAPEDAARIGSLVRQAVRALLAGAA